MSNDNQEDLGLFIQELNSIVDTVISESNKLLSVFDELSYLYRPKTQEEAGDFYSLKIELQYSVRLLYKLQKNIMPDNDNSLIKLRQLEMGL